MFYYQSFSPAEVKENYLTPSAILFGLDSHASKIRPFVILSFFLSLGVKFFQINEQGLPLSPSCLGLKRDALLALNSKIRLDPSHYYLFVLDFSFRLPSPSGIIFSISTPLKVSFFRIFSAVYLSVCLFALFCIFKFPFYLLSSNLTNTCIHCIRLFNMFITYLSFICIYTHKIGEISLPQYQLSSHVSSVNKTLFKLSIFVSSICSCSCQVLLVGYRLLVQL